MIYGFDEKTKECLWTADGDVNIPEGMIVLQSDDDHDITQIELGVNDTGDYYIAPLTITDGMRIDRAKSERLDSLAFAKEQINILTDLKEFSKKPEYESMLNDWRKYRVELYEMDITDPDNIKWPKRPTPVDM
jgi:Caudovirales tail fibre assembly protein.